MERQGDHVTQKQTPLKRNHWTPIEIAVKSISFLVLILLIVALGVDKLNTASAGDVELTCRWKELEATNTKLDKSESQSYKKSCDNGVEDTCDVETIGEVWLAFGILGIFAQTAAIASMTLVLLTSDESIISKEAILRVAALGIVCLLVLIQFAVWQAKGCGHYDETDWDMGPSMIVVILAWILSLIATALQVANTMSILRRPSVKQASTDVEDGASIRS